jgi:hypothetical protein
VSESAWLAALAGAVVAVVAWISPGNRALALDVYVLVAGALGLLALARVARAAESRGGSRLDEALADDAPGPERPLELARLERVVSLSLASGFDFHYRLRPILREIADHRLRRRRGSGLDDASPVARDALGERTWDLLRTDRPAPADRQARELRLDELGGVVDDLERI